ncbi:unnamed protein product, partial [Prorocentrum cordatum]
PSGAQPWQAPALRVSAEPGQISPRPQPRAGRLGARGAAVLWGAASGSLRCSGPLVPTLPSTGLGLTLLPTGALGSGRSAVESGAVEAAAGPRRVARDRARAGPPAAAATPARPKRAAAMAPRAGKRRAAPAAAPRAVARAVRQSHAKSESVSAQTARACEQRRTRVVHFHGRPLPRDQAKLDPILVACLTEPFDREAVSAGRVMMAAVACGQNASFAAGKTSAPRSKRAPQGWCKEGPELAREPRPWISLALVAEQLVKEGDDGVAAARAAALMQDGYFRPSEVFNIHLSDVADVSKRGPFDDAAILRIDAGRAYLRELVEALLAEAASAPSPKLFPSLSLAEFEGLFKGAAAADELDHVELAPRMLRRGGPGEGVLTGRRALAQVQERGRWEARASACKYAGGGRVLGQVRKLAAEQQRHGAGLLRKLPFLLGLSVRRPC